MDQEFMKKMNRMFAPESVAVIGAGAHPDKVGHAIMDSLVFGGFRGEIYPVHPKHQEILGLRVYKDLEQLPKTPDLAVVALNQRATVETISRLRQMGVSGVSAIAGGYAEMGEEGLELQERLKEAAGDMPVVGPNTLGFLNAWARLNVTFYPRKLNPGNLSFLSQSGGIGLAIKGRCHDEGLGLAKWIGVGNRVNLEFHTLLEFLRNDPDTKVIGIFIEGAPAAHEFFIELRKTTPIKPVVVLKGGRGKDADHNTVTHTAASAGSQEIWEAALKQAGALPVDSTWEMVALCKALSLCDPPVGRKVGIFTHTAGPSIVAWDILKKTPGCELSKLNHITLEKIANILGPSVPVIHKNPVDAAAGGFLTKPFHDIAEAILEDPDTQSLIAIFCEHKNWVYPTEGLIELSRRFDQPIIACFIGSIARLGPDRERLHQAGVPVYTMPEEAALGLSALFSRQA
jgi:acetyltransferase